MNRRKSYPDFILGNYLHKKCDLYESFDFFGSLKHVYWMIVHCDLLILKVHSKY